MIGSVCRRLEPEHPIRYGCGLQPGLPGDILSLSLGGPAVGGSSLRGAFPPFRGLPRKGQESTSLGADAPSCGSSVL